MNEFLEKTYYGNEIKAYIIALSIIVAAIIAIRIFRVIILRRLKNWSERTETVYDDWVVKTVERSGMPALNFIAIYVGIKTLNLNEFSDNMLRVAASSVIAYFLIRLISRSSQHVLEGWVRQGENGEEKVKQMKGIILILNFLIWGLGIVFLFDNLGYDVTAVVAGLGVGGIAIALAAQNILGDLFNYFVIFFDRPFEINDFIVVDDKAGTVEHIGIKTTRLKSLSGEQLILSNSDLTNSRIHNYKRMQRRRIVFKIGVVYDTTPELLREIPTIIRKVIDDAEMATLDRTHFANFGDFSLNFETVYFVESSEYGDYMSIQQQINLAVFEAFSQKGIEFAYPTQTLFVNRIES